MAYLCEKCGWKTDLTIRIPTCPKCKALEAAAKQPPHPGVLQTRRLISWLTFYGKYFRPNDKGVGDTVLWLCMRSAHHPETFKELNKLLKRCSCDTETSINKLNQQYPY